MTTTNGTALLEALAQATADTPVRLGRYYVVGRQDRGGMSAVYKALDRERRTTGSFMRHLWK